MCYAWSVDNNCITVFDPLLTTETSSDLGGLHLQVTSSLKRAMWDIISRIFDGCNDRWEMESVSMIQSNQPKDEW